MDIAIKNQGLEGKFDDIKVMLHFESMIEWAK